MGNKGTQEHVQKYPSKIPPKNLQQYHVQKYPSKIPCAKIPFKQPVTTTKDG
jgi:hypothetical protein